MLTWIRTHVRALAIAFGLIWVALMVFAWTVDLPASRFKGPLDSLDDLDAACPDGSTKFPQAKAFQGKGPASHRRPRT